MRRRQARDRKGQMAVLDAILFFSIMIVASVLVYVIPAQLTAQGVDISNREHRTKAVKNTLDSALVSTVEETSYVKDGETIYLRALDIHRLIIVYMELEYEKENNGAAIQSDGLREMIKSKFQLATPEHFKFRLDLSYDTAMNDPVERRLSYEAVTDGQSTVYAASETLNTGKAAVTVVLNMWR